MGPFLSRLRHGDVVLGDGAWGTMLMARGLRPGEPPERWCLEQAETLTEIAGLYLEAGAEIVTTNTFGASPLRLSPHHFEERTEEICRAAVAAVRRAVADRAYVSASVGPCGRLIAPLGDVTPAEVSASFERQIASLAEAGADLVCIETMTDLLEATLAVKASRAVAPGLPIVATMTFDETPRGFFTMMGVSVEKAVRGLLDAGADVVGSNCGSGIVAMTAVAIEMRRVSDAPVAIRPNAGLPVDENGVLVHPETPDEFARRAPALLDAGVRLLGGCCGTTPDHVRALRRVVNRRDAKIAGTS